MVDGQLRKELVDGAQGALRSLHWYSEAVDYCLFHKPAEKINHILSSKVMTTFIFKYEPQLNIDFLEIAVQNQITCEGSISQ